MSDCSEYSSEKYFLWSYTSPPWISSLIAEAILLVGQPEKGVFHAYRWLSSYNFEPEKAVIYAKSAKDINALPVIFKLWFLVGSKIKRDVVELPDNLPFLARNTVIDFLIVSSEVPGGKSVTNFFTSI